MENLVHKKRMPFAFFSLLLLLSSLAGGLYAQQPVSSAADIQISLQRLNTVGSVLHIAAHPDDENTLLLAYFARHRNLRTGYLSLTRGEGGQNLIGSEQGIFMGLIRTQELLAARRIDAAEQFFSRAIDFGFTKTPVEAIARWGREETLGDIVYTIRKFRPDIIFLRFSGTPTDGHGQHQASAILATEAFAAAADPKRFPEQLTEVQPFQSRRLYFNQFGFTPEQEKENARVAGRMEIEAGEFNPILGLSYGEIEGLSRSQHSSQAMGWPQRRGSRKEYFVLIAGEPASKDPLEGIDTTWNRLPGGAAVGTLLAAAIRDFQPSAPARSLPSLLKVRQAMAKIDHPEARRRIEQLDEILAGCAGIWMEASANAFQATPGSKVKLDVRVTSRSGTATAFRGVTLQGFPAPFPVGRKETALAYNQPLAFSGEIEIPAAQPPTQPYWLQRDRQGDRYQLPARTLTGKAESDPLLTARFHFAIDGVDFYATRAVDHRYVDSARGELTRPLVVVPPVTMEFSDSTVLFPDVQPRTVQVTVTANQAKAAGRVRLEAPAGWKFEPAYRDYSLEAVNQQTSVSFRITPPQADSSAEVRAIATQQQQDYDRSMRVIRYPHIPPQTVFSPATAKLVRAEIKVLSRSIGYVMGAGDQIPDNLRQLGLQVTLLSDEELATSDLAHFDAIVAGIRAFNTRPALRANMQRLLDFTSNGGTLIVQYNVKGYVNTQPNDALSHIGPYPITIDHDRVTVEDSPVNLANHPVMNSPNKITKADFEGWVQERGLYFARSFDSHYTSLFATHDPNEDWLPGGMLYTKYGKGAYVFTGYSWFRQLPAGVPGAFRIFANLLSAAKVQ